MQNLNISVFLFKKFKIESDIILNMEILELRIRKLYNISGKEIFDQRWEKAERKQHLLSNFTYSFINTKYGIQQTNINPKSGESPYLFYSSYPLDHVDRFNVGTS